MSDSIDRQAAIDAVSKACEECRGTFARCEEKLLALPSAKLKKGWWMEITESDISGYDPVLAGYKDPVVGYVCSVCHNGYEKEVMGEVIWNFCPNCGADMRGEKYE